MDGHPLIRQKCRGSPSEQRRDAAAPVDERRQNHGADQAFRRPRYNQRPILGAGQQTTCVRELRINSALSAHAGGSAIPDNSQIILDTDETEADNAVRPSIYGFAPVAALRWLR